jgi:DNA-binding IclR family transcriptional regulator
MTTNRKRNEKDYAVEKTIQTVRILESLEGTSFEPITTKTIIERVGIIPDVKNQLTNDSATRILLTLKLLGWVQQDAKKRWSIAPKVLRFAQNYSQIYISAMNK